jgi:hypothetical protein
MVVVKSILLTHGKVALVDDEDYEWLSKHKWFALKPGKNWYAARGKYLPPRNERLTYMSREIWEHHHGPIPTGLVVDHIDGNTLDDRKMSLRLVTVLINAQNYHKRKERDLPVGVYRTGDRYRAQVVVNHRTYRLGRFATPEEASEARQAFKKWVLAALIKEMESALDNKLKS